MCPTSNFDIQTEPSPRFAYMLSLHNQEVSFLGRSVPPPTPPSGRGSSFVKFPILKPDQRVKIPLAFPNILVISICFGLLALFIPLVSDLKEVIEDAMFYGWTELLKK